jgi:ankyrin repeat protein
VRPRPVCRAGSADASLGFDLARESPKGGTPLHWAAWYGRVDAVRTLLDLGAPIDVRDKTYGSSSIAWAAHGSCYCRKSDDDYVASVEMLLDLNPDHTASINRWGEPRPTTRAAPP